jgi:hypothetical protein
MGVGAPPSAKEEIETALRSTRVASIRRTIFFMRNSSWEPAREQPYFFWRRKFEVFEKRAMKNTDPSVYRQDESSAWPLQALSRDEYSLLLLPVARVTAGGRGEI